MKKLVIKIPRSPEKKYPIYIGKELLANIGSLINLSRYSKIAIVTDENVAKLWLKKASDAISIPCVSIIIQEGEKVKSIETVKEIWSKMIDAKLDRKSLVINIGGGVTSDMGGFAASTFMRGVDFLNIPTTLLAQVDASVGGKTGFDLSGIKNLIGTFTQPVGVVIDIETLTTLPKREFLSGFSEIIKHGLIKDKTYFEKVIIKRPSQFTQDELITIIAKSVEIKAAIVAGDETEKDRRKILNFGHTIGHAVESLCLATSQPLLHGEAISIGMLAEAEISHNMNLLSASDLQRIRQVLTNAELPISVPSGEILQILEKIKFDKKNENGMVNFTLLHGIGNALYNQNVSDTFITEAIKKNS